jgi:SapC
MSTSFYRNPVLVSPQQHAQYKIAPLCNYEFVAQTNAVYVAGIEFADAGKEYPIVFTRINEEICPVLMFGLRDGENLFVRSDGSWSGHYIPAFVRRYPFVLANIKGFTSDGQLGVCVDEAYSGWNVPNGAALFDQKGGQTSYFKRVLSFLTRYQQEYTRTSQFCKRLDGLGLLGAMDAQATLFDGRTFHVNGLMIVQESRMSTLSDAQVLALYRSGDLALIHAHLNSLPNLKKLLSIMGNSHEYQDFQDTLS